MKSTSLFIVSIAVLVIITGCEKGPDKNNAANQQTQLQQTVAQGTSGKVIEKVNDGDGYTFVLIDTGTAQFWAAAPEFQVSTGSVVVVPEGTRLTDYHNKPLNRTFDVVVFVDAITEAPAGQVVSPKPGDTQASAAPATAK